MNRCIMTLLAISMSVAMLGAYTFDYSASDFLIYKENQYDRIQTKEGLSVDEPGTPELPVVLLNYIVPPHVRVESLIILESNIQEIVGQFLVYPSQQSIVPGETVPWVPPDTLIYNSNDVYPAKYIKIVNEGIMDGARVVALAIYPIQYRPQSKRLFLNSYIEFEFAFTTVNPPELRPLVRGKYEQILYDAAIRDVVENDQEIPAYYQKPTLVEENQLGTLAPIPMAPCVIITDPAFFSDFQSYADWVTEQGIKTVMVSPQLIYTNYPGVDSAEKIRNYIKACYEYEGGTYFLLGGMDSRFQTPIPYEVPVRWCFCLDVLPGSPPHYDTIPCDFYYSALDGDWDANWNGTYGEMNDNVDQFPEVFVGRILCRDTEEVKNWCYKALSYEKLPINVNSLTEVKWITTSNWYMGWAKEEFPEHFSHYEYEDITAYEAFNVLNSDHGFTHAQTHGSILGFPTNVDSPPHEIYYYTASPPDPGYYRAGLNWLTNDDKSFLHYCVGCNTGFFDDPNLPCVAECLTTRYQNTITHTPIGACATIEHTRYSLHPQSHYLQARYYERLFMLEAPWNPQEFAKIGYALALAKTLMFWDVPEHRFVSYGTNLFGSPITDAWTNIPSNFDVSHPMEIYQGQQTNFTVQVAEGSRAKPVVYAKVCLYKPNDIFEVGRTGTNGRVTFTITPNSTGTLKVTVTRFHNDGTSYEQYLPSSTTCIVSDNPSEGGQTLSSIELVPTSLGITHMPTIVKKVTSINYGIPKKGKIHFAIYDISGSLVKTIRDDVMQPGYYLDKIDPKGLSSGIYFAVLQQRHGKDVKKFIVTR